MGVGFRFRSGITQGAASQMEEQGFEGRALAGEESGRPALRFSEGVEGRELVVWFRTKTVSAITGVDFSMDGKHGREGVCVGVRRKSNLFLKRQLSQ